MTLNRMARITIILNVLQNVIFMDVIDCKCFAYECYDEFHCDVCREVKCHCYECCSTLLPAALLLLRRV